MNHATRSITLSTAMVLLATAAGAQGAKPLKKCAPDAVVSGTVCMDKYEASVWRVPNPTSVNKGLVKKITQGKATAADLAAGGAIHLGKTSDDYAPCADNGQNCADDIYAVSLPGVTPSQYVTWFQAQAACKGSRKRLPTNAEWQAAVAGTPDPGPDNGTTTCASTGSPAPVATGSRSACVSSDGAFDMVGNVAELVAEWVPRSSAVGSWSATVSPTGDFQGWSGAASGSEPGVLMRGGEYISGTATGPFAINGGNKPSDSFDAVGFRCAR